MWKQAYESGGEGHEGGCSPSGKKEALFLAWGYSQPAPLHVGLETGGLESLANHQEGSRLEHSF